MNPPPRGEPFIAGRYARGGGASEARRSELAHALGDGEAVDVATDGPLTVAARAMPELPPELPLCVLEGSIYNLDAVAQAAGLTAGADAPEATLARAYARLGAGLLERLRGDFALVLWDREAERGLIARDQLGGRGIVWHAAGDRLLFATEVRQLLALLPHTPGPDDAALAHWVASSGIPADRTLFAGIRRLPLAHCLLLEDGGWEVSRYWAPRRRRPLRAPREELAERLRATLAEAVARRGAGDGAILLSGGLDSSTIAALAAGLERERRPGRCYSAVFPRHGSADESALIDMLCGAFGFENVRALVRGGGTLRGSLAYLDHWRLPPVSGNMFFWVPLFSRARADGTRTLLTGEGGDEMFGHCPPLIADRLRQGRLLAARSLLYRIPGPDGPPSRDAVRRMAPLIMRRHGLRAATPAAAHRVVRRARGAARYAPEWLTEAAARAFFESHDPTGWKRVRAPRWWAYRVDLAVTGLGAAQTYDDFRRRAALTGLEARHPFRDVDVLELVLRLPPELFFDRRWSRPLLREAMAGLLPDEVRLRPAKSVIDSVARESLAGPELPVARTLLSPRDAELRGFVDLRKIQSGLLDRPPPASSPALAVWAAQVWRLLSAECWLRTLADPGFPSRLADDGSLPRSDVELLEWPVERARLPSGGRR